MAKQLQRPDRIGQRLSTSDSLKTTDVWQKTIKYDPYAETGETTDATLIQETGEINSSAKGLFQLARLTGSSTTVTPGSCKHCGQVGHLAKQCRNWMKFNLKSAVEENMENAPDEEDDPDSDPDNAEPENSSDADSSSSGSDTPSSDSSSSSGSSVPKKKKKKKKKKKGKKKKDNKEKKKKKKKKKKGKKEGKKRKHSD